MNVDQAFYELVRLVRRFQALGMHCTKSNEFVWILKLIYQWYALFLISFFFISYTERPGSAADDNDAYDGSRRRGGGNRKKCTIL